MIENQVVAACDDAGRLWWFPVVDADYWHSSTLACDELFHAAGRWVIRNLEAAVCGEPARIVDESEALTWLLSNGYAPPASLTACAEKHRLR